MVYIPFLKIDIPEPRLQEVVPNTICFIISLLSRVLDTANAVIHPLSKEGREAYTRAIEDVLPRELKSVLAKYDAGIIKDEAKLSSEVEEACYDYYRRTIRQNIAGYSDEETEDWAERKTFDRRSPQAEVLEAYERQRQEQLASTSRRLDPLLESDEGRRDPEQLQHYLAEQEELLQSYSAAAQLELEQRQAALQRRQRSLPGRLVGVTANGALGLAAGVGAMRLLRMLQQRLARGRGRPSAAAGKAGAKQRAPQAVAKGTGAKKRAPGSASSKAGTQRRRPTQ